MKLRDILNNSSNILTEQLVQSSWLEDISFYGRHNNIFPGEEFVTFKVKNNPKIYVCRGVTKHDFVNWIKASSPGKHWHKKFKHIINRDWFTTNPFKIINYGKIKPRRK